jgi:Zn-dependent M28 family amino/carboxypeptidase
MWGAPGANDNGGGSAAVLALARAASESPLPFAIDFIWFTGEESNMLGSRAYVDGLSDAELKEIRLLLNLDGIAEAGDQLHIWPGNENVEYQILQCLREYPPRRDRKTRHIYTFPPRPGMDHVPFYERGVTDMVSFTGFEMVNYHTARDVFHPEQGPNLEYATRLAWHLLQNVSADPSGPIFRDRLQLQTFAAAEVGIGLPGRK